MERAHRRRRNAPGASGLVWVLAIALLAGTSCVSTSDAGQREASVYAAVVRWFVSPDPDAQVFLDRVGETEIDLAVQAEVVYLLDDLASVRFIDEREEAVEAELPGAPVRDASVFLLLGPVEGGGTASVEVTRYLSEESVETYRFTLRRRGGVWEVEGQPEMVQSGD